MSPFSFALGVLETFSLPREEPPWSHYRRPKEWCCDAVSVTKKCQRHWREFFSLPDPFFVASSASRRRRIMHHIALRHHHDDDGTTAAATKPLDACVWSNERDVPPTFTIICSLCFGASKGRNAGQTLLRHGVCKSERVLSNSTANEMIVKADVGSSVWIL